MDRSTSGAAVLAILLALYAMALALMHPSLLVLAILIAAVSVLICPSPPGHGLHRRRHDQPLAGASRPDPIAHSC
jgi:hypothetical protein